MNLYKQHSTTKLILPLQTNVWSSLKKFAKKYRQGYHQMLTL